MENNNQTPAPTQQTAPVTNPVPAPVAPAPVNPPVNNISNLKDKFNSLPPQQKRLMIIGGAALGIALIALILAGILKSTRPTTPAYVPTPTPATSTPFPESNIDRPSIYATDSAILKLEASVNEISKSIDAMDLEESQLRPQDINFKVDFGD